MESQNERESQETISEVANPVDALVKRRVVCAANKYGDLIVCGARHHDNVMNAQIRAIGRSKCRPTEGYQGFIDQFGCFMSRQEALSIAIECGQPLDMKRNSGNGKDLYSEGLY